MSLEGMTSRRGVTGVAEVQGRVAFVADLHIVSRVVAFENQTFLHSRNSEGDGPTSPFP